MAETGNRPRVSKAGQIVNAILTECEDPARLLELYYWSTEPELLPLIRGLASLPSETRRQLGAFLRATDPALVSAMTDANCGICLVPTDEPGPAAPCSKRHH